MSFTASFQETSVIGSNPRDLVLREWCGLHHEPQVIEVTFSDEEAAVFQVQSNGGHERHFVYEDLHSGLQWPLQVATSGRTGYLFVELPADATLHLRLHEVPPNGADKNTPSVDADHAGCVVELSNGRVAVRCLLGEELDPNGNRVPAGPVLATRAGDGVWRGGTVFDCRSPIIRRRGRVVETGAVRTVYEFRAELLNGGWYGARLILDRSTDFVRIRETFSTDEGDQLVWDFAGKDLPSDLHVLDSSAGMASRLLDYSIDRQQARLWCWTQQSQLFDLVDGFALTFGDEKDAFGMVTLASGDWRGRRLNHIEVWTRRWNAATPWTRRRTPIETRADASPGPDFISARGRPQNQSHLTLEAWLGKGCREFALVLASAATLWPGPRDQKGTLEHFEWAPAPERYRAEQGLLRRLHIQRGLFSLESQLATAWDWDAPSENKCAVVFDEALRRHIPFAEEDPFSPANIVQMRDYLEARVLGFWAGSGAAYTNPVVSRGIAPYMEYFEWLVAHERLEPADKQRLRSWLVFLAALFASDNYYPGGATMLPLEDTDCTEPTLAGMANQNFYTDVFNVGGIAAQVFSNHPCAQKWRARSVSHWSRQMDYHVYPESGVWEESHTYYLHVLLTMWPLLKRWRNDGVINYFEDARLQKLVGSVLTQITPRDDTYGCLRHLLAWGDHDAKPTAAAIATLADYAGAFVPHALGLAEGLGWLVHEMGGNVGSLPVRAPEWRSTDIRGLGFVFRTHTSAAGEILLALRAGAAWGHHHNDDGSLQLFAFGRAWIVDTCHGHAPLDRSKKFSASGHSRMFPVGFEAANHLWRFSRGWISQAQADDSGAALPHAVAWLPTQLMLSGLKSWPQPLTRPFLARRCVVQLTSAVFAVIDEHDGQHEHEVRFQLAVPQVEIEGATLRGTVTRNRIELSAAGSSQGWKIDERDVPKDGELSRATWPCGSRVAKDGWHLTIVALLADDDVSPVVIPLADGADIDLRHESKNFTLRREAEGDSRTWTVVNVTSRVADSSSKTDAPTRIPMSFGFAQP